MKPERGVLRARDVAHQRAQLRRTRVPCAGLESKTADRRGGDESMPDGTPALLFAPTACTTIVVLEMFSVLALPNRWVDWA